MTDEEFFQTVRGLIGHQQGAGLPIMQSTLDIRRTLRGAKSKLKELEQTRKELLTEMEQPQNDYSIKPRGSRGKNVSMVELEAERRERIGRKLEKVEQEINTLRRAVDCLKILPPADRNIIERLYLRREGTLKVSLDYGVDERNLRGLAKKALWTVGLAFLSGWSPGTCHQMTAPTAD